MIFLKLIYVMEIGKSKKKKYKSFLLKIDDDNEWWLFRSFQKPLNILSYSFLSSDPSIFYPLSS